MVKIQASAQAANNKGISGFQNQKFGYLFDKMQRLASVKCLVHITTGTCFLNILLRKIEGKLKQLDGFNFLLLGVAVQRLESMVHILVFNFMIFFGHLKKLKFRFLMMLNLIIRTYSFQVEKGRIEFSITIEQKK